MRQAIQTLCDRSAQRWNRHGQCEGQVGELVPSNVEWPLSMKDGAAQGIIDHALRHHAKCIFCGDESLGARGLSFCRV
jgi:hypothetical protein